MKNLNHSQCANNLVEKCLFYNFNRNDILISFGGGILGDLGALLQV